MTVNEVKTLRAKIKAECLRRNGYGSITNYGSSAYDFATTPTSNSKVLVEQGQKTVDVFLHIEDYKDLKIVKKNDPIPVAFNAQYITKEVDRLATEVKTGESAKTVKNLFPNKKPEVSSCRGACTGLCVGTCINNCNGCTSCTASCGTGCESGCTSCQGCTGCTASCGTGCAGGCMTAKA